MRGVVFKKTERVGAGHHQSGNAVVEGGFQLFGIDDSVVGGNVHHLIARQRGGGGVGAVCGIGDEDLCLVVALVPVIGGNEHDARELSVGARHGLEREGFHARDFTELLLEFPDDLKGALRIMSGSAQLRHERMQGGEARQCGHLFHELGIIFHGAGAEGIKVSVHREVEPGKARKMTHHVQFRQFGQTGTLLAEQGRRKHVGRPPGRSARHDSEAAGTGLREDCFHYMPPLSSEAIISQRMPICSRLCFSVQATSSTLSMPL